MTLIACKECTSKVSDQADSCPQCGVPNPTISYEEERLQSEIDKWKKEEDYHADRYNYYMGKKFLIFPTHGKETKRHVDLANEAQRKGRELQERLWALEREKYRSE